ncbi:hypothetical protein F751_0892 [Auxenochlorella protothecoides]|uniref:Uncharacterized protein n=1 Tax=Auxenochlorella protothecoides TaxID=3075 RepID=A0A087SI00_AUXPR|nr:hypothetical protein F751_0892 [Auxenochlorella protothecoides]KFM25354.1 hypothetical protein F751_0892 [Auxenochlorella protothecoides]
MCGQGFGMLQGAVPVHAHHPAVDVGQGDTIPHTPDLPPFHTPGRQTAWCRQSVGPSVLADSACLPVSLPAGPWILQPPSERVPAAPWRLAVPASARLE